MPSVGDSASIIFSVTDGATAIALGSGDVPVLGTPKVVALCEEAAVAALDGTLPDGATSVGAHITVDHNAPTAVGRTVTATATVTAADGRVVEFSVFVTEGETVVATGRHIRMVVDRNRFVARLA
jgi:fluoroacetyl-CoA thioesterase